MSAEDRQQCQDITCGLGGHERCHEEDYDDVGGFLSVQVSEG